MLTKTVSLLKTGCVRVTCPSLEFDPAMFSAEAGSNSIDDHP
jgi:hypothetical protein